VWSVLLQEGISGYRLKVLPEQTTYIELVFLREGGYLTDKCSECYYAVQKARINTSTVPYIVATIHA